MIAASHGDPRYHCSDNFSQHIRKVCWICEHWQLVQRTKQQLSAVFSSTTTWAKDHIHDDLRVWTLHLLCLFHCSTSGRFMLCCEAMLNLVWPKRLDRFNKASDLYSASRTTLWKQETITVMRKSGVSLWSWCVGVKTFLSKRGENGEKQSSMTWTLTSKAI